MNPYFQQARPAVPQLQGQNLPPNFQHMQASYGQQVYGIPNPYQGASAWPQPYIMPGYQYPYHVGAMPLQVPIQQPGSHAVSQVTNSAVPPLPGSKASEQAPLPPLPDTSTQSIKPPPPDEEPVAEAKYGSRGESINMFPANDGPNDEKESGVDFKSAISSFTVSKQSVTTEDDLETLQNQLNELENQMKKYQSEYQEWFKEFSAWRKQHENHPDKKKYVEYQQKYQKLIEQQQQALKEQYIELQSRIKQKRESSQSFFQSEQKGKPVQTPHVILGAAKSNTMPPVYNRRNEINAGDMSMARNQDDKGDQTPTFSPMQAARNHMQGQFNMPQQLQNKGNPGMADEKVNQVQLKSFEKLNQDTRLNPSPFYHYQSVSQSKDSMQQQSSVSSQYQKQGLPSTNYQIPLHSQETMPQSRAADHYEGDTHQKDVSKEVPSRQFQQGNVLPGNEIQPQSVKPMQPGQPRYSTYQTYTQHQNVQGAKPLLPRSSMHEQSAMQSVGHPRFSTPHQQQVQFNQRTPYGGPRQLRPFYPQQPLPNQSRNQDDLNRNLYSQFSNDGLQKPALSNSLRMPYSKESQGQPLTKNIPIPSLMSQEIPNKDYYNRGQPAEICDVEDRKEDKVVKPEGQSFSEVVLKNAVNKRGELKSSFRDDFAIDDMTGMDNWESEGKEYINLYILKSHIISLAFGMYYALTLHSCGISVGRFFDSLAFVQVLQCHMVKRDLLRTFYANLLHESKHSTSGMKIIIYLFSRAPHTSLSIRISSLKMAAQE